MPKEGFKSRWGFIIASLGMAIGTGNIWRFPRVISQNGGGVFIVPWILALFVWSLPLIFLEYSMGAKHRKGVVSTFQEIFSKRNGWVGGFIAAVTGGIMFYYSVVTGWALFYTLASVATPSKMFNSEVFWNSFQASHLSLFFHFLAIFTVAFILSKGVSGGIEKATRIMIPSLFLLLVLSAIRAVTLPGGIKGLDFLFYPNFHKLLNYRVWLEALSQSAWSTGAGWGLILTYSVYTKKREDGFTNSAVVVFGNNSASILAAIVVVSTIFAFYPDPIKANSILSSGNTGLTFIWIPKLLSGVPLSWLFSFLFFSALSLAALSSLISLMELAVSVIMDFGLTRLKAVALIGFVGFIFGIPSAFSVNFLNNQDWVWGLALLVNGVIFSAALWKIKDKFKEYVRGCTKYRVEKYIKFIVMYIIPVEFALLILWWFSSVMKGKWYNPFSTYSPATVILQWLAVALILILVFSRAYRRRNEN